ncbi:TonB-dependent receptor plug domain-containing protein [Pedobacter cryoconitis]|uniref:Outer membrane receptor for ferrienterochelin and colicins n=1 Tax=Pedobacter cryoconitis TaxID=188932 RepID=A0A7X0J9L7_9SPHI|nr:TonB-dependent receptor [Pedobacter cryoconitis]MBB6502467.1 outer membrane receptor for ferrienterochelin and colicins [Pedobacter cryoconitis]
MRIGLLLVTIFIFTATIHAQDKTVVSQKKKDTTANNLKEVVVTGEYQPQSLKNSVYRTRIINAERIRLKAATSIQQVLNTELGFRFSNDMALGTTDVQMMGMSGRSIKILLDGVPMLDRSDARESLAQIDINTVERIEIVEGPLSVSYGSDALVGVINIITKRPGKENLNINARVQEETVGTEYAPFGKSGMHTQHLGAGWRNKNWNALAGLTREDFNGFNVISPTTTADESLANPNRWKPKKKWFANARVGYNDDNLNIWYRLDYVNENIDSRGPYIANVNKSKNQQYITNRYTQQLQGDYRFNNKLQLSGSLSYNDLRRATKTTEHDFAAGTDRLTDGLGEQDVAKFRTGTVRTTLQYKLSDQIAFQPGVEVTLDGASAARIKGNPTINDYAFFISSTLDVIKGVTIRPGFRFIKNSVYDAPPVIPSLNTKIKLTDKLDFRLGYASGFRAPALRELYYDFVDANHTILGNENLKAEQSNSFTASFSLDAVQTKELTVSSVLGGFYNNIKNQINFVTSETDGGVTTLYNVDRFRTVGGTLDNTLLWKDFQATLGFAMIGSYNKFSAVSTLYGESPEFVWSPEINTNLSYSFPRLGAILNLSAKFNGTTRRYQDYTENGVQKIKLTKVASSTIADLMITKKLFKTLNLNAGVNNLFNITTLNSTATATGGAHSTGGGSIPLSYGRSYVVGLSFNWAKD